uniref:PH domain-containing protein n=1 Tax=Ascaris lumbricoides TaxID=6252 RepID=A0A0M3I351_ASCLU
MSTGGEVNSIFRRIYNRWWKRTDNEPEIGDSESSFGEIVRTIASSGNILKSGYLSKKRWKIGSISKYFVLRDDAKFYYYKSRNDSNIPQNYSGVVQLKDVYIMPHGSRVFSIHSNNGVWRLKAKNSEERDGWIKKLRFARACMQAKEENELIQFTSGGSEQRKEGFDANALPDLDRRLTVHSSELHPSGGRHSARKSNRSTEYLDDPSITMSIRFKNFKAAAKIYLQQSAAIQDYIRRINEELRYVSEQRTNLIRQVETQAKQLKMISKPMNGEFNHDFDTCEMEEDDMSVTGSDESEKQKCESKKMAGKTGKADQQKKGKKSASHIQTAIEKTEMFDRRTNNAEKNGEKGKSAHKIAQTHRGEKGSVSGRSSTTKKQRAKEITTQIEGISKQVDDEKGTEKSEVTTNGLSTARDEISSETDIVGKEMQSSTLHAVRNAEDIAEEMNEKPRGAKHDDPMLLSRSNEIIRKRRTRIPDRKAAGFALWSILKNALGKELSRIPLPVDFNEPLSFIQRMSEVLEYSSLLDSAATIQSSSLQMVYVTAFVISCWSNTPFRTCKPFNPLWSETFEFDRTADLGWKSIAEQVSHHPPIGVLHAEGRGWMYDEEMCVISQFQATAMRLYPEGCSTLSFPGTNTLYTWTKKNVKTFVKGFIVGPLIVHNEGVCIIQNTTNGERCRIELSPHSFFSSSSNRSFVAKVFDRAGKPIYTLEGDWSKYCNLIIENSLEEGVAPTDSRRRPDMRLMENGDWAAANEEKCRLEQKQRAATRRYQEMIESRKPVIERPVWFKKVTDSRSEGFHYKYGGDYWKCKNAQDWRKCPDIFGRS